MGHSAYRRGCGRGLRDPNPVALPDPRYPTAVQPKGSADARTPGKRRDPQHRLPRRIRGIARAFGHHDPVVPRGTWYAVGPTPRPAVHGVGETAGDTVRAT